MIIWSIFVLISLPLPSLFSLSFFSLFITLLNSHNLFPSPSFGGRRYVTIMSFNVFFTWIFLTLSLMYSKNNELLSTGFRNVSIPSVFLARAQSARVTRPPAPARVTFWCWKSSRATPPHRVSTKSATRSFTSAVWSVIPTLCASSTVSVTRRDARVLPWNTANTAPWPTFWNTADN